MKKVIMTISLVLVLAIVTFGYVSTPVTTYPPSEPNHPQVMAKKTVYIGKPTTFQILVEDSNDDSVTVTAVGGTVSKSTALVDWNNEPLGYVGDTIVTDADGTFVFHIYRTMYDILFLPIEEGYQYPEIKVTDSEGAADIKYVELNVLKKNITPIITGCR
jgi:hypothetical protein